MRGKHFSSNDDVIAAEEEYFSAPTKNHYKIINWRNIILIYDFGTFSNNIAGAELIFTISQQMRCTSPSGCIDQKKFGRTKIRKFKKLGIWKKAKFSVLSYSIAPFVSLAS